MIIRQGIRSCNVTRWDEARLLAQSCYLAGRDECMVSLGIDVQTFRILSGTWETAGGASGAERGQCRSLDSLVGKPAYLDFKLSHADYEALPFMICELIKDTVRGAIQAETYLQKERGYRAAHEYDMYWDEIYDKKCRFYSYPHTDDPSWSRHVGEYVHSHTLFNRYKTFAIHKEGENRLVAKGVFKDSFHELAADFEADLSAGAIVSANAAYFRAPGAACFECGTAVRTLLNQPVALDKKTLARTLGGGEGCFHLLDLMNDLFHEAHTALIGAPPPRGYITVQHC